MSEPPPPTPTPKKGSRIELAESTPIAVRPLPTPSRQVSAPIHLEESSSIPSTRKLPQPPTRQGSNPIISIEPPTPTSTPSPNVRPLPRSNSNPPPPSTITSSPSLSSASSSIEVLSGVKTRTASTPTNLEQAFRQLPQPSRSTDALEVLSSSTSTSSSSSSSSSYLPSSASRPLPQPSSKSGFVPSPSPVSTPTAASNPNNSLEVKTSSSSLSPTPPSRPRGLTTGELPRPNFGKWAGNSNINGTGQQTLPQKQPQQSQPPLPQPVSHLSSPVPLTRPRGRSGGPEQLPPVTNGLTESAPIQRPLPSNFTPSSSGYQSRPTPGSLPPRTAPPSSTLVSLVPGESTQTKIDQTRKTETERKASTLPRGFTPKGFEKRTSSDTIAAEQPLTAPLPAPPTRTAPLPRRKSEDAATFVVATSASTSSLTGGSTTSEPQRKGSRIAPTPTPQSGSRLAPIGDSTTVSLSASSTNIPLSPTRPHNPPPQSAMIQELQTKQKGSRVTPVAPTTTTKLTSLDSRPSPLPDFEIEEETPPPPEAVPAPPSPSPTVVSRTNSKGSGIDSDKEASYLSSLMKKTKRESQMVTNKKEETVTGRWVQDDTGEWQQLLQPALIKVFPSDFQEEEVQGGSRRRRIKAIYVLDGSSQQQSGSTIGGSEKDFRRSRRSTMICPSIEPEENDDHDPETNYLTITQDPRYQRFLLKYAPDLCSKKGIRQQVKNYIDPASIPVFNMICRSYRACRLMHNVKQLGQLEKTMHSGELRTNEFVQHSVEHMEIGLKVETAGQTTDAMVTTVFTCLPFTYIVPGLGIAGSVISTVLTAGVKMAVGESLSQAAQKTAKAVISNEAPKDETESSAMVREAQEDYGETKALLLYLGLPKTNDKLYEMWEDARLSLKVLYGAKPEEDLRIMEPNGELEEALKHAEQHDDKYDMASLSVKYSGISLLLMLWRVYQCWKVLYYDRARSLAEKRNWISITADERDRLQDERYVYELLHPLPPNVILMDNRDYLHDIVALLMEEPYGSWCPSGPRASFLFKDPFRPTTEERAHLRWFVRGLVKFWLTCAEIYGWLDLQYDSKLVAVLLWEPPETDLTALFGAFLKLYSIKGCFKFGISNYNQLSSRILAEEQIRASQLKSEGRKIYGAIHYFSATQHKLAYVDSLRTVNDKVPSYYAFDSPMQKLILSVVTYINQPSYATLYCHNSPQKRVLLCADFQKIGGSAGDFLVYRHQPRGPITHVAPAKPLPTVPEPSTPQWKKVASIPSLPTISTQIELEQPTTQWKRMINVPIESSSEALAPVGASLSSAHSPTMPKRSGPPLHAATSPQQPRKQS